MVKRLIVNADDFNTDEDRNRGIIQAARDGIVSSTSLLANIPLDDYWREELLSTFSGIGVHLNITSGRPLTKGLKTITGNDGSFMSKTTVWLKAFRRQLDLDELEQEFTAQINRVKDAGINPDHVDGNNHIHVFPGVAGVVARVANETGISRIRLPAERLFPWRLFPLRAFLKKVFIGILCLGARTVFFNAGLCFPDFFAGIHYPDVSDIESVRKFLKLLPEGTTELMCHPGYASDSGNPFSNSCRREELHTLTNPHILVEIKNCKIKLETFSII